MKKIFLYICIYTIILLHTTTKTSDIPKVQGSAESTSNSIVVKDAGELTISCWFSSDIIDHKKRIIVSDNGSLSIGIGNVKYYGTAFLCFAGGLYLGSRYPDFFKPFFSR